MKPFSQQTHYELLEIPPTATDDDIKTAYATSLELYGEESIGLYSLVDPAQAEDLRQRLKVAAEVLLDDAQRRAYDLKLGLPPRPAKKVPPPSDLPPPSAQLSLPMDTPVAPISVSPLSPLPGAPGTQAPTPSPVATVQVRPLSAPPSVPPAPVAPPVEAPPPLSAPVFASVAAPQPVEPTPAPMPPEPVVVAPPPLPVVVAPPPLPPAQIVVATPVAPPPSPPNATPDTKLTTRPRFLDIPPEAEFNGELLRRIRESSGRTLSQLADKTRISKSHLENVEADRYTALPAPVYLRGILMNLARELGLDPIRVSKSYLALAQPPPPAPAPE